VGDDGAYPPYSFINDEGQPDGFHVELMQAIADKLGREVEFSLGVWKEKRTALEQGKIDLLPMFYSPFRDLTFDFTEPHTIIYHEIFKRASAESIREINDLDGRKVALQDAAYAHDFIQNHECEPRLTTVISELDAMHLLEDGKASYAIVSEHLGRRYIREQDSKIRSTGSPVMPVMYTFAVKEGQDELKNQINQALLELKDNGTFDEIYNAWFAPVDVPQGIFTQTFIEYATWIGGILLLGGMLVFGWIQILHQQVQNRTQELDSALEQKTVLLSEINHRVKNNLAVIHGLLTIQKERMDLPQCEGELEDSISRIKSMALIHNFLYDNEDLSAIDMHSYVMRLAQEIQSEYLDSNSSINFDMEVDPVTLSMDQAVPCGLVLNELLINAVRHAFKGQKGGLITLRVNRADQNVEIVVKDDGIGLGDEFNPDGKEGTGFTIINLLMRQLNADWEINRKGGTEVRLRFEIDSVYSRA
jgi:two-component sensor histidine kinase